MPAVVIKYKSARTLKALQDFAKYFDFVIEDLTKKEVAPKRNTKLPITYADQPNVTALAGIWEGSSLTLEDIRKKDWGNRI